MKFSLRKTIDYNDGAFSGLASVIGRPDYTKYELLQDGNYLGCMLGGAEHNHYAVTGLFLNKGFTRRVNAGIGTALLRGLALESKKAGYEYLALMYTRNYIVLRMAYEKLSYACEYITNGAQGDTQKTNFAGRKWFDGQNIMVETDLARPILPYRYENKFIPLAPEARQLEGFFQGNRVFFHEKTTKRIFDPAKIYRIEIFSSDYMNIIVPLDKLNF